jgi:Tfp pilus assembly protein PilF
MTWYTNAMQLNPYDAYAPVGCGMCLDRLGETRAATPYFEMAARNDPQNNYIDLEEARHCIELGDFPAAKKWLDAAQKWAATAVAYEEWRKLEEFMNDDPLLKGHK